MASVIRNIESLDRKIELSIFNNGTIFQPIVQDEITWETVRKGSPGKITFKVLKDEVIDFQEGNPVKLIIDGENIFFGFVFTKSRDKENNISVTAYDQLRYFKNKDTYVYKNKTAAALLKMICNDFQLQWGNVEDTQYTIPSRVEDNTTLFDIMQNAIDETLKNKKKLYVLYDDFGKLALRDIESMKLNLIIDQETGENFEYKTSIDSNTYNKIKLIYEDSNTKKREVYITKDSSHINQWGVLQYTEKIQDKANGKAKADALLELYNSKTRNLSIKNAFGNLKVRGGSSVIVNLSLGDIKVLNYMVVEKVKHTFKNGQHNMDLTLIGGTQKGVQFSA